MVWAASPARNTRPAWKVSATSATARHLSTSSMCDLEVGLTDGVAHHLDGELVGRDVGHVAGAGLVDVADGEDDQEPSEPGLLQPEEAAQLGVVDVDHAQVPAPQRVRAVGPEVDRDAPGEQAVAPHGDAQVLADGAPVAVAGDEVLRPDGALDQGVDVADRRGHPVRVLLQVDQLGGVLEPGAELAGPLEQDRLEHLLRHEQPARGAHVRHVRVDVRDVVGDLLAGQGLDRVEAAIGLVELQRGRPHAGLDAGDAHELDGAQVEVAGTRVDGGPFVLLDRQRLHPVVGQEHGVGQADQAAAHYQDGHLHIYARAGEGVFVMTISVRQGGSS